MPNEMSDAFVFFGATGDLAYKQIFPSLQRLIKDEGFNLPIIVRARERLAKCRGIVGNSPQSSIVDPSR